MQTDSLGATADTLMTQQIGLTADSLWFFVDLRNPGNPYCLECKPFETDTFFRTVLKISVDANNHNKFLTIDSVNANWFYTFSFVPADSNSVVGISNSFNKYYDAALFNDSLEAWQRYRIAVFYKECKHFDAPPPSLLVNLDDVMKPRELNAMMWFAGSNHGSNTFSDIPRAPENYSELNLHGWKASNDSNPFLTNMNQQFADSFIFYCEMNGGLHYFFAQDLLFSAGYSGDVNSCGILMKATALSRTAGNIYDPYPFEYRPPSLYLNQLAFQQPAGFSAAAGITYNYFYAPFYQSPSVHFSLPLPGVNNFITLNTQSISPPVCLDELLFNNISSTDSSAYVRDGANSSYWEINFQPDNCFANFVAKGDTAIYALYGNIVLPCMLSAGCTTGDTIKAINNEYNLTSRANLQINIQHTSNGAISNEMCWHVELTNPYAIIDSAFNFHTAAAAHIYFVPPGAGFLNNWKFSPDLPLNYTINIPNGTIFHWADSLPVDGSLAGNFCAEYFPCVGPDDTDITFIAGYDCNHFPAVPFGSDTNCTTYLIGDKQMHDVKTNPPVPSSNPVTFSICHETEKIVDYTTQTTPYIYPDSLVLYNMPPQIIIDSVAFTLCSSGATLHPLQPSGIANHWLISKDTLDSTGYVDGALTDLYNFRYIRIHLFLHQECDFINGVTSDSLVLFSHNHCDSLYPSAFNNTTFIWNDSSYCTDCFTLTKTVDKDSALTGDTLTYTITACANNSTSQSVMIYDSLPQNFVWITNPLVTPQFPLMPDSGCITYTVKGYFTQPDTCTNTQNRVYMITAGGTRKDSACVTILYPCYKPSYIFIGDSTVAKSLPQTTYTNDTLIIQGRFYIDTDFALINCVVYAYPGANIIVKSTISFTLTNTTITACTQMWRGIYLEDDHSGIRATGSIITDAETGVWARGYNYVYMDGCQVNNCITGVKLLNPSFPNPAAIDSATAGYIRGSSIGKTATFKPSFAGQSNYDTLHTTGIDMQNKFFNIGNNSYTKNYIHHTYYGIRTENGISTVTNTQFENIKPGVAEVAPKSSAIFVTGNKQQAGSNVRVQPLNDVTVPTVINCYRGVFSFYSDITVVGTTMLGVNQGITVNSGSNLKAAVLYGNTIAAKTRGISFNNNAGAKVGSAILNYIYMSGNAAGKGININETNNSANTNYDISYNHIFLLNESEGISVNNALSPVVLHNIVRMAHIGDSICNGISLINCMYATASCNQITGSNPADTNQVGMSTKTSTATDMVCNSTDSTGWGVYFEGPNNPTNFSTTSMTNNNEGLRLYNNAYIGQQLHKGNQFVYPFGSTYGAVDNGNPLLSPFFVDSNDGAFLFPSTPTLNWFFQDSGITEFCNQNSYCNIQTNSISIDSLMERIVTDSIVSTDFIEESVEIARDKLFSYLSGDSVQYYNDTVLTNFMLANIDGALGDIYIAEKYIAACYNINDTSAREIILIDTIAAYYLSQMNFYDTTYEYERRSQYIDSLNQLVERRNFITDSLESYNNSYLDAAKAALEYVELEGVPRENKIKVMELLIRMMTGSSTLDEIEGEFADVANQCPASGGPAVLIARAALEEKYDTLYYDDRGNCAALGYYRQQIKNNKNLLSPSVLLIPNPASSSVTIELTEKDVIDNIEVFGNIGTKIGSFRNVNKSFMKLNIGDFTNGVYTIIVKTKSEYYLSTKLIVIR